jgi:hypothetical protein
MKNSNDTIGNRTRDLTACSIVPQPTTPRRGGKNPPLHVVSLHAAAIRGTCGGGGGRRARVVGGGGGAGVV